MVDSSDDVIWLAFAVGVSLASIITAISVAPSVVVVIAPGEVIAFLLPFVGPSLHHITKLDDGRRSVTSKILIEALCCDAIVEAVDDVFIEDVGDGCLRNASRTTLGTHFSLASTMRGHDGWLPCAWSSGSCR
jgi:hypothetical protein